MSLTFSFWTRWSIRSLGVRGSPKVAQNICESQYWERDVGPVLGEIPIGHQEIFSVWGWPSTEGEWRSQWDLHPWRSSGFGCLWPWSDNFNRSCFEQEDGEGALRDLLQPSHMDESSSTCFSACTNGHHTVTKIPAQLPWYSPSPGCEIVQYRECP